MGWVAKSYVRYVPFMLWLFKIPVSNGIKYVSPRRNINYNTSASSGLRS
jgi:hypothetical protein